MSDVAKTANQWTQEEIDESDVEAKRLHELLNRPRTNPTSGRDGAVNECAGWVNPIAAFKAGWDAALRSIELPVTSHLVAENKRLLIEIERLKRDQP